MKENEEVRLQKYISDCGLMSRRRAEEEILAGNITVNGERVELGRKIVPEHDFVEYRGEVVAHREKEYTYIMLNKPRGVLTSMSDDRGRVCVSDLTRDVGCRVYPCGRLDYDSSGLLIMTDDGELANKLTHPSRHISKLYRVTVTGDVTPETILRLQSPMTIDGYALKPVKVRLAESGHGTSVLLFTLHEGRNRQIRKMCEKVDLSISSLCRIAIGKITLGNLPRGAWVHLTREQVDYLKNF